MPTNLGFKCVELQPGEHLRGLYAGVRQGDEILLPFLQADLQADNKCICIVEGTALTEIVAALGASGAERTRGRRIPPVGEV